MTIQAHYESSPTMSIGSRVGTGVESKKTSEAPKVLRGLQDLPGPRGLPLVGNLLQIRSNAMHLQVEQWARRYGSLYRFRLGATDVLVISGHEAASGVLRDRPQDFRRVPIMETIIHEMGLPTGVFIAEGEQWQRQRRMVMAGLDPRHVKAYFPSLLRVTDRLCKRWCRAAKDGELLDLQPELMRFTVDVIAGLAFGSDVNTIESGDDVIQRHLDRIFPMLQKRMYAALPLWRLVRTPSDRALERSVKEVNAAVGDFIAAARERLAADSARRANPPNVLEAMIVAAGTADHHENDLEIAGNVLTLLLAGEDTTANTLAWMIWLMRCHPDTLGRARDEVRHLAPDASSLTLEQLAQLRYLDACTHEAMRLKPTAPYTPLEARRDVAIGDVRVPKGTMVWVHLRGDTMSERYFPEPNSFRPERWLGLDESGGAPTSGATKRVSMPFGAGPRICPGRYLALLEIKMAMAMLLANFEIDDVFTADGGEPREHLSFTMMPWGLRMRLSERMPGSQYPLPS